MKDDQQQIDELEAALDGARHETRQWVDEHLKWRQRAEAAEAELAQIRQERDEIAEELASNRACNLFTWKERATKAEAARDHLRARLRELVKKWEAHAPVMIGGNEMIECAADLLAILSEPEEAQQTDQQERA